jgi:hypothetical protein
MGFDVKDLPEDDGSDPFLWALNVSSLTAAMDDVIGDVGGILKQTDYLAQALVVEGGVPYTSVACKPPSEDGRPYREVATSSRDYGDGH